MKAIAVIPARWGSTRFPGKPLAAIAGKTLIQRVWERCREAGCFDRILVATDDQRILQSVRQFGGEAIRTPSACASGTDRVAYVAKRVSGDVFLNVQGDGPFVEKEELRGCVKALRKMGEREIVTTAAPIRTRRQWEDSSVVKVVFDQKGYALYFSRSPIPFPRNDGWKPGNFWAHLSVYGFRKKDLLAFCRLKVGCLEKIESLEMLRAMEAGWKIRILPAGAIHPEIDRPEDIRAAEAFLRKHRF